jgi:hypothetical protein
MGFTEESTAAREDKDRFFRRAWPVRPPPPAPSLARATSDRRDNALAMT